jgi:TonB family protein
MRLPVALTALLAVAVAPMAGGAGDGRRQGEQSFRIIQTEQPEFPMNVDTMALTEGEARIVFSIDHEGRLADLLVASYSHRSFADEAVRVLRAWRYEPALQYGEPIGVRASMTFRFEAKGQVISTLAIDSMTSMFSALAGATVTNRVASPDELDAPVTTLQVVKPRHPGMGRRNDLSAGRVVLDFYIDEEGRPRMPVVLSSDDSAFAEAAVEALGGWRFVPPTRRGQPVLVRVQQAFSFTEIPSRNT